MDDSDANRLEHGKKVTFFDYHWRFLPLSHPFKDDRKSFMKGKRVRKGPPKQKLEADITQMLDDLKESGNGKFEGYSENHNWAHKSCLWELPYVKALILPYNIDLMHQVPPEQPPQLTTDEAMNQAFGTSSEDEEDEDEEDEAEEVGEEEADGGHQDRAQQDWGQQHNYRFLFLVNFYSQLD
jgi:hypothetical protein